MEEWEEVEEEAPPETAKVAEAEPGPLDPPLPPEGGSRASAESRARRREEKDNRAYDSASWIVSLVPDILAYYKSKGIRPCHIHHLHAAIRAAFGYH